MCPWWRADHRFFFLYVYATICNGQPFDANQKHGHIYLRLDVQYVSSGDYQKSKSDATYEIDKKTIFWSIFLQWLHVTAQYFRNQNQTAASPYKIFWKQTFILFFLIQINFNYLSHILCTRKKVIKEKPDKPNRV
jgi:hypothetical protein